MNKLHPCLPALLIATVMMFAGCDDGAGTNANTGGGGSAPAGSNTKTPANNDAVLVFTAIPDQNTTELKAKFGPVAEYLSEKLGVTVEYKPVTDYNSSVEMFAKGDVQLAWFGGLTGVQARARVPGAQAIAQGEEDPQYKSYFIAHKSTGLTRSDAFPTAIKDLPFAFGEAASTSGRLMPTHYIIENTGKTPDEFFTTPPIFSGSHDKTVELVRAGTQVKAGVLNYKVYEKWVARDPAVAEEAPVIWVTPTYADYNFTAHPKLAEMFGAGFIDQLQTALIAMDDSKLLGAFPRNRLIRAKNEDFDGIVAVAKDLGFLE